jgi:NodT family efflux transporter outer membrane factor (OMF) lipoprotein
VKAVAVRAIPPFIALAALGACAVGPDFKRPAPPEAQAYTAEPLAKVTAATDAPAGAQQRFVEDMNIPAQWWTLFQSPKLNLLVERSLKGNPSVEAAKAALRQAHELYSAQWTAFLPTIQGGFSQERSKYPSGALTPPTNAPNPYYSLYTAQLTLSYAPDVFGGTRRAVESAKAQEEVTRFQLEATYLTLTSNVVVTALQEAALGAQIDATQRMVAIEHDLTETVRRQREIGTAAELDLLLQQSTEAQTRATLPPLSKQLEQAHDAMAALLGGFPDDRSIARLSLADVTLPRDLPVTLPSKLIEQRPDVRQAEETLHSATAEVGVAVANMLPQFALTGDIGSSALGAGQLFTPYNGFWTLGSSLTQTLFDAGALLHKRRAADAAMDQAAAQYRSTVVAAVQNVADALRALQSDADAVKADNEAAQAAERTFQIAQGQVRLGTITQVALLSAEVTYQQAELSLIQAEASRFSDTAGLFQALGGGWWNRGDAADEPRAKPES